MKFKDCTDKVAAFLVPFKWPFVALAAFILFHDKLLSVFDSVLVLPLLSTIKPNIGIDLLMLGISVIICGYYLRAVVNGVRFSRQQTIWMVLALMIYCYIRFVDKDRYAFYHFHLPLLKNLAIIDTTLLIPAGHIIYYIAQYLKSMYNATSPTNDQNGFLIDIPIDKQEEDKYERWGHIPTLVDKLQATKNETHSFSIAIIGKWGDGKTSYINGIKKELEKHPGIIDFEFNPWMVSSSQKITTTFFDDLSSKLAVYDKALKNDLIAYSSKIIKGYDNDAIKPVKLLLDILSSDHDLARQYEDINSSIARLKKKIFVRIDDVDRLQGDEIIEVLRLIRNTANFGNMLFFVAFDRSYVIASLNKTLGENSYQYLEKIFQLEYFLPLNNNAQKIDQDFRNSLLPYLSDEDKKIFSQLYNIQHHAKAPAFAKYLGTPRDIKRFVNTFILNYDLIEKDVHIRDYIWICILKFRYPELYKALYLKRDTFLTTEAKSTGNTSAEASRYLVAIPEKMGSAPSVPSIASQELTKNRHIYTIPESEVPTAIALLADIFPVRNHGNVFNATTTEYKEYLSITRIECFDRYFDFTLDKRLRERTFYDALDLDLPLLMQKIEEWCNDREIKSDLGIKLEHINNFDGKEQFEKVIVAIVHYANLENEDRLSNNFNKENFIEKLGGIAPKATIVQTYYKGDSDAFKSFVKSLFKLPTEGHALSYMQILKRELFAENNKTFILSQDEMTEVSLPFYYRQLASAKKFDVPLRLFFNSLVQFDNNSAILQNESNDELRRHTREFILNNDFEGFLAWCVRIEDIWYEQKINYWNISLVFDDEQKFETLLNERANTSDAVKEYLDFYTQRKEQSSPIKYDFKHLNAFNFSR